MPLPRFIDSDGRRHLLRDLVALRQAQAKPRTEQPILFELYEDHRPSGERKRRRTLDQPCRQLHFDQPQWTQLRHPASCTRPG
jgi:hypothetical protein